MTNLGILFLSYVIDMLVTNCLINWIFVISLLIALISGLFFLLNNVFLGIITDNKKNTIIIGIIMLIFGLVAWFLSPYLVCA